MYTWSESKKEIIYTHTGLLKLYRNVSHSSADKLFYFLKLASSMKIDSQNGHILKEFNNCCNTCQRLNSPLICLKVSLRTEEDPIYGGELSIYLILLNEKAVLQIVEAAIRFSVASFLNSTGASY